MPSKIRSFNIPEIVEHGIEVLLLPPKRQQVQGSGMSHSREDLSHKESEKEVANDKVASDASTIISNTNVHLVDGAAQRKDQTYSAANEKIPKASGEPEGDQDTSDVESYLDIGLKVGRDKERRSNQAENHTKVACGYGKKSEIDEKGFEDFENGFDDMSAPFRHAQHAGKSSQDRFNLQGQDSSNTHFHGGTFAKPVPQPAKEPSVVTLPLRPSSTSSHLEEPASFSLPPLPPRSPPLLIPMITKRRTLAIRLRDHFDEDGNFDQAQYNRDWGLDQLPDVRREFHRIGWETRRVRFVRLRPPGSKRRNPRACFPNSNKTPDELPGLRKGGEHQKDTGKSEDDDATKSANEKKSIITRTMITSVSRTPLYPPSESRIWGDYLVLLSKDQTRQSYNKPKFGANQWNLLAQGSAYGTVVIMKVSLRKMSIGIDQTEDLDQDGEIIERKATAGRKKEEDDGDMGQELETPEREEKASREMGKEGGELGKGGEKPRRRKSGGKGKKKEDRLEDPLRLWFESLPEGLEEEDWALEEIVTKAAAGQ